MPYLSHSFQLERGDFLSEDWRERIANTRYFSIFKIILIHLKSFFLL